MPPTGTTSTPTRPRSRTPLEAMLESLARQGAGADQFIRQQVKDGTVRTPADLLHALGSQRAIPEQKLWRSYADALELPFIDIDWVDVDKALHQKVGVEFCVKRRCLPLRRVEGLLELAISDPTDLQLAAEVQARVNLQVVRLLAMPSQLDRLLMALSADSAAVGASLARLDRGSLEELARGGISEKASTGIAELAKRLILLTVSKRASDLHLEPLDEGMRVRLRCDGILREELIIDPVAASALVNWTKISSGMDIAEKRLPQDGRLSIDAGAARFDLRVSTVPTVRGEKVVMRLMDTGRMTLDLEQLSFSKRILPAYNRVLESPDGIIFVTGPTGSGKTTTLYASLARMASPEVNVTTVEDPVETRLGGINQVQTHAKIGLTFVRVLRACLRQDPDVILIGEIRDQETAEAALQAALTGHLVLSTLHTNSAPETVTRLVDLGVPGYLIAQAMRGSLGQRLVRKLCQGCRSPVPMTAEERSRLGIPPGEDLTVYLPLGCDACRGTGFRGRLPVHELLVLNDRTATAIAAGASLDEWLVPARAAGYRPLLHDGVVKALAGLTTVEEVLSIAQSSESP